jgi:two-component system invasion response regulator UvrY
MKTVKILLVDDHEIARSGLKTFIRNFVPNADIEEACNGDAALKKVTQDEHDLIILDAYMPGTDSFSLVTQILGERPRSKILIFTISKEVTCWQRYLELGALGYLNKEAPVDDMRKAIVNVMNNKIYFCPALTENITQFALDKNAQT